MEYLLDTYTPIHVDTSQCIGYSFGTSIFMMTYLIHIECTYFYANQKKISKVM